MTKKKRILIARVPLFVGSAIYLYFVPWLIVKAWILPLPETIQEQVDEAISYGFEEINYLSVKIPK